MAKTKQKTMTSEATVAPANTMPSTQPKGFALPQFPTKLAFKRETLMKVGIIVLVILIAIPLLDWLIQTSITAKYAAFYKNNDITHDQYVKALEEQYGTTVLQGLLVRSAVFEAAKAKGITVTDAEVNASIDEIKKTNNITTDAQYQEALQGANLTAKQFYDNRLFNMTVERLIGPTVKDPTDAEVKAFFTANAEQYTGKKFETIKAQVATDAKAAALSTAEQAWLTAELENYDGKNILVDPANSSYRFLRSIELVNRLFSSNPNTK